MESNMDQDKIRQKKLYFIVEKLKEFHSKVDAEIQNRIPLEDLVQTGEKKLFLINLKLVLILILS